VLPGRGRLAHVVVPDLPRRRFGHCLGHSRVRARVDVIRVLARFGIQLLCDDSRICIAVFSATTCPKTFKLVPALHISEAAPSSLINRRLFVRPVADKKRFAP